MEAQRPAIKTILARNIRLAREKRGYSQAELAERTGFSAGHVSDLEQGRKWLSAVTIERLAGALGLEPYMLLLPPSYSGGQDPFMLLSEYAASVRAQLDGALDDSLRSVLSKGHDAPEAEDDSPTN